MVKVEGSYDDSDDNGDVNEEEEGEEEVLFIDSQLALYSPSHTLVH